MEIELLKKAITDIVTITDEELNEFCSYFKLKKVKRNDYLLKEGAICKFEAFVIKGNFSILYSRENGKDYTSCFGMKGEWVTDLDSFMNNTPAELSIQAIEDSEVLIISKTDKEKCYKKMHAIDKAFRIIYQKILIHYKDMFVNSINKTAEERYLDLKEHLPAFHRLTNIQIASYLGVSREFLGKIRKKIAQN